MKTQSFRWPALPGLMVSIICAFNGARAASDLWMRDDPSDTGAEPNNVSPVLYLSDDIWVRRVADPNYDPQPFPTASPTWTPLPHQGPCYRDPKTSSPNYIYVRIRNRGNSGSSGTETLHVYWAKASTGLAWPGDWNDHLANPCGGASRLYGFEVTKPRKNGATATAAEINAYTNAIAKIDATPYEFVGPPLTTYYDKQDIIHQFVFQANANAVHGTLQFLPWHREMMNRYENLLREVSPAVTLLYWDWTTSPKPQIVNCSPSSTGCTPGFMGFANGSVSDVFGSFGIFRTTSSGTPSGGQGITYQQNTLLPSADYATFNDRDEDFPHNSAHGFIGGTVTSFNAVRDPMFFMIHANCDRLWAWWQRTNSSNVDRWTPSQAYDANQADPAISGATSYLRPFDGTGSIPPWLTQNAPADPNGYIIQKEPVHHSIVYPPIYEDVLLKIPVLAAGESCIIEIPFYPPPLVECGSFVDPQHLCLLARIEPMTAPAEGASLWQNVKDHNNIAWRNVTLSDCNSGPFFRLVPGRIGAGAEIIRNLREQPARITLRFQEARAGFRSLFEYGPVRLRLSDNLYNAWLQGGRQGQGVEPTGTNEILVFSSGASIDGIVLAKREVGNMDLALELNKNYPEPFGDIYRLDVLQYDDQGGQEPVGGQRYELDFNLLSIVAKGEDWKFLDGGQVPPTDWPFVNFDDKPWKTGTALFGFGRPDAVTGLRDDAIGQPTTAYFRHTFNVPDPTFYRSLALNVIQDDGLVVYLNGREIARLNMPTGAITHFTAASSQMTGAGARACRSIPLSDVRLLAGQNILAAEVHPAPLATVPLPVDMTFDLELAGNVPQTPYQPPTVVIAAPENGLLLRSGSNVVIRADVVDPDGDLQEIRLFLDGVLTARTNRGPLTATSRPPPGGHRVSVEAQDAFAHVTRMESVFTVISNLNPVVEMTMPMGERFPSGTPVHLMANAFDRDGSIRQVAFYVSTHFGPAIPVGISTSATTPYTVDAVNLAPGSYKAFARATDNEGGIGHSMATHFLVGSPRLTIRFDDGAGNRVPTLNWSEHNSFLERATAVTGPWRDVADAATPYAINSPARAGFYRLRVEPGQHN